MKVNENIPDKCGFDKIPYKTKSLGNGFIMVYGLKDNLAICKLEKRHDKWNIIESCTKYINYGYETKSEAVVSAYYCKDCRIYKTGYI